MMLAMNNRAKILAHPTAMSGGSTREPIWNELTWSRELLSKMIKKRFPDMLSTWVGEDGLITWIEPNWTPKDCIYHAELLLQAPPSPVHLHQKKIDTDTGGFLAAFAALERGQQNGSPPDPPSERQTDNSFFYSLFLIS